MNALSKAMNRSLAVVSSAEVGAMQLKRAGMLGRQLVSDAGLFAGLGSTQSRSGYNYSQFRGWLYAAINALASEGAQQPVYMSRVSKEDSPDKEREEKRILHGTKAYYANKMTDSVSARMRVKTVDHSLEIVDSHPLLDSLEYPNPIQHRWQFVYSFIANLNLTGWAYVVGGETDDGKMEFYSIPTTWIIPIHDKGPFSEFKIVNPKNANAQDDTPTLTRDQVAFAHLPNPSDPLSAMAPASSQMMSIRIDDHIQTSQEAFFNNGIFPSVVVTVGKDPHPGAIGGIRPRLSGQQRRQVHAAIKKVMGGVANYGNPAIVDGLIEKIDRLSATQNEMGWDKSEDKVRTRILSAFCVNPYILGEPINVGGYSQAAKIEERFCKRVNTFLDMLGNVMTNFVGKFDQDKKKKGSKSDLIVWWEKTEPHDPSLIWTNLREARKNGDITRDEIRAKLGFPPAEKEKAERSKLLEAVGGVNAAVQIFNSVGSGAIPTDAAAKLFELFFEISAEEAKELVANAGQPQQDQMGAGFGEEEEDITFWDDDTYEYEVQQQQEEGEEIELANASKALGAAVHALRMSPGDIEGALRIGSKRLTAQIVRKLQ